MDPVTHFEIPATDKNAAKEFYSSIFGWNITEFPLDDGAGTYSSAATTEVDHTMRPTQPGAINGAIVDRQGQITAPVITITVESIDDALRKITEAGGRVVIAKQDVENMGHYAYFADPAGNTMGLWEKLAH